MKRVSIKKLILVDLLLVEGNVYALLKFKALTEKSTVHTLMHKN